MVRVLAVLAVLSAPALAQPVAWRAATEYPATSMPGQGLSTLARELEGTVSVTPAFDAPAGLRSATIPAAVQSGRLDVGDTFAGALAGQDPVFQLSSLPFLAISTAQARLLLDLARPAYERAFARLGQRLLYTTPWPPSGIWSRDPLADVRSLAIRTYDATATEVLRRAGADPVELSFADTMPRLRDGSVRAVLSSGDGGAGRRLWEVTPNFTAIGYAMPLSFTTVSDRALAGLDQAQQRAVLTAGGRTEAAQWLALDGRVAANYAEMRRNGVTITTAPPQLRAALTEAAQATIAAWAAGAGEDSARLLATYRQQAGKD